MKMKRKLKKLLEFLIRKRLEKSLLLSSSMSLLKLSTHTIVGIFTYMNMYITMDVYVAQCLDNDYYASSWMRVQDADS